MLINFTEIVNKYNLKIKGILHIGAHLAEEIIEYTKNNINDVIWIEANPKIFEKLSLIAYRNNVRMKTNNICYNNAIYSIDDLTLKFNITNNGESSSLLELNTHKTEHPTIHVTDIIEVKTKRLDTLIKEENIDIDKYNFINLDIQGTELHALKGFGDFLGKIDYIYTEVNNKYLYTDCALINELDDFLKSKGFKRMETKWTVHEWGDALYIRSI